MRFLFPYHYQALSLYRLRAILYCCALLFISLTSYSQSRQDWKSRIDYLVDEIDSLAMKTQNTFIVTKYLKNNDPYKETWHYTTRDNKIVYFEIRYVIGPDEFTEIYYVNRNRPICVEQYEAPYMAYYVDELKDGRMYFIEEDEVRLFVTLGRNPDKRGNYVFSDMNCLQKFDNRFTELQKTMQYLK